MSIGTAIVVSVAILVCVPCLLLFVLSVGVVRVAQLDDRREVESRMRIAKVREDLARKMIK